jgi:predicted NAD-dependent protein-ADP-ribosyltransferase YbiA (DUF1768 family)
MYDIKFGRASQSFFELSPFFFCTYSIGGKKWRTLIHYWTASFFNNDEMKDIVRGLDTPERAILVGKRYGLKDFNQIDPKIILTGIQERFNQCDGVRGVLLSTGDSNLIYTVPGYLSDNNRYGKILMKVREIYASK